MKKISGSILDFFVAKKWVVCEDEDYYEAYAYAIKDWMIKLIFIAIVTCIAIFFQQVFEMAGFIIGFVLFRRFAGGVHFSSSKWCMFFSILLCLGNCILMKFSTYPVVAVVVIVAAGVSLINTIAFAPLVHSFDPKSADQLTKMRKLSFFSVGTCFLSAVLTIALRNAHPFFYSYCFGVGMASMTLLLAWLENNISDRKEYQS